MVHIISDAMNIAIGKIPERKAFKNIEEGVNNANSFFLAKQSNDMNGVEVDPSLSTGAKIWPKTLGKLILNERKVVITCR